MFKKNKANKQKGGDGYVINVNEAIGGLPAFSRYSNNYRPIFDGELLQNSGDGYSVDPNIDIFLSSLSISLSIIYGVINFARLINSFAILVKSVPYNNVFF